MAHKRSKNKKPAAPNDQKPDILQELHVPCLPQQFVCLTMRKISSMVVTKSWGTVPRECCDSTFTKTLPLVAHKTNHIIQVPFSYYKAKINKRNKPFDGCHRLKFIGISEGSFVREDGFKFGYNHLISSAAYFVDLNSKIYHACVAHYSINVNHFNPTTCITVVLTGISCPMIITRERPKSWINCDMRNLKLRKYGCNLVDPNDPGQGYMRLCTGIWFEGKFYALSLQGTVVVLQFGIDHEPLITDLGSRRTVPCSTTRHYREYLLESNGKILLVFLLSKKSVKIVDDVEVFELNVSNLSWKKVRRLRDMTALFLGPNCSMLINTSELDSGCNSSCVYFTNIKFDGWMIYDMENCCIRKGFWNGLNFTSHK